MHRSLRAVITSAALLAVAGLAIPTDVDAAVVKKTTVVVKRTTTVVAPRRGPVVVAPRRGPVVVAPRRGPVVVAPRRGPVVVAPRRGPVVVAPRVVGPARVVSPVVVAPRRSYFARPLVLGGRPYTVVTGPRVIYWRGARRSLIPLAALGVITVGAVGYRAYGYVPVEQPLCEGPTPDGCELRWQEVPTVEGDVVPQCVAFCPQQ